MPRPSWEGHLRLSLVTCPVALYKATTEAQDIHFHLIHPKTNNRVRMVAKDPDLGEVARTDLVKGYEFQKGKYVLFDKDDLDAVKLESTRIIDIESFVPLSSIDRIYWNEPYYLLPGGKTGIDAFSVIRRAMEMREKVALGRLVISTRERMCAIEARGDSLLLTTLRSHDEIVPVKDISGSLRIPKPEKNMLEIAGKIIDQQAAEFDPSHFTDRYEDALRALIAQKRKGKPVEVAAPSEPEEDKVVDLMDALKRSLEGNGDNRQRAARYIAAREGKKTAAKPRARKTPARQRRKAA